MGATPGCKMVPPRERGTHVLVVGDVRCRCRLHRRSVGSRGVQKGHRHLPGMVMATDEGPSMNGSDQTYGAWGFPSRRSATLVGSRPNPIGPRPNPIGPRPNPIGPRPNPIGPRPNPIGPRPNPIGSRPNPIGPRPNPIGPRPNPIGPRPNPTGSRAVRPPWPPGWRC